MGIYSLSEWLYDNPPPLRPAYNISGRELPLEAVKEPEPVAQTPTIGLADAGRGARIFRQCAACHTANEQGANRVGPSLWHIVDRPVAALPNYRYSSALQELGQKGAIWDERRLDAYINAPAQAVKGTSMAFRGLSDTAARAALIAYLRTLIPQNEPQKDQSHD